MSITGLEANFKDAWSGATLGTYGENPEMKNPFDIHIFPNLLDDNVVGKIRDAVHSSVKLKPKDNDLYKFKQSKDLKTQIQAKKLPPILHEFIDLMMDKVRKHLEKMTGKKLSEKNFDITASRYDVGNYLLCHNDDIKDSSKNSGRSIAFVYYLNSRIWTKEDGGSLILYNSDSKGEPVSINNKILPKPNTLVVFDTTATSWHSVEEVFCRDDFRLSINGWYHSPQTIRSIEPEKSIESCPYDLIKPTVLSDKSEKFFKEYLNQDYLMEKTCFMIRKRFKRKSEINLTNFLVKEKYEEISLALKEATRKEENLSHVGPYNKRNYRVLKQEKLPQVCRDLYDAFRSDLFFMLLSRLTGLDLNPPENKGDEQGAQPNVKQTDSSGSSDDDEDDDDEDDDDDDDESDPLEDETDEDEDEEDEDEDEEEDEARKKGAGAEEEEDDDEGPGKLNISENEEGDKSKRIKLEASDESVKKQKFDEPTTSKEKLEAIKLSGKKKKRKSNPLARIQYRHLEHGSYTLIHDYGYELGEKSALDVMLHFNHDFEVNFDDGGYISYIDGTPEDDLHDMDCELLTVEPRSNCLSLVYRCDESTCRFLKHISKSHKNNYQDLYCVYYERPDDLPHSC